MLPRLTISVQNVFLLAIFSGYLFLILIRLVDRNYHRKGKRLNYFYFLGAGLLSPFLAWLLYAIQSLFVPQMIPDGMANSVIHEWISTGPVEEVSKFLSFLTVANILKSIKEPQDGCLQGALTALGFAIFENFLYDLDYGEFVPVLRVVVSMPGHMIDVTIWGGYYGYEVYVGGGKCRRWGIILLAIFVSGCAHALFNTELTVRAQPAVWVITEIFELALGVLLFTHIRRLSPYEVNHRLSDWQSAIPFLRNAIRVDPEAPLLRRNVAAYFLAAKRPREALAELDTAQDLALADPLVNFYRAAALTQLGDVKGAERQISRFRGSVGASRARKFNKLFERLAVVSLASNDTKSAQVL